MANGFAQFARGFFSHGAARMDAEADAKSEADMKRAESVAAYERVMSQNQNQLEQIKMNRTMEGDNDLKKVRLKQELDREDMRAAMKQYGIDVDPSSLPGTIYSTRPSAPIPNIKVTDSTNPDDQLKAELGITNTPNENPELANLPEQDTMTPGPNAAGGVTARIPDDLKAGMTQDQQAVPEVQESPASKTIAMREAWIANRRKEQQASKAASIYNSVKQGRVPDVSDANKIGADIELQQLKWAEEDAKAGNQEADTTKKAVEDFEKAHKAAADKTGNPFVDKLSFTDAEYGESIKKTDKTKQYASDIISDILKANPEARNLTGVQLYDDVRDPVQKAITASMAVKKGDKAKIDAAKAALKQSVESYITKYNIQDVDTLKDKLRKAGNLYIIEDKKK